MQAMQLQRQMTVGCKKVHVDLRFKFNCKHGGAESITVNMFIKFVRTNFEFWFK